MMKPTTNKTRGDMKTKRATEPAPLDFMQMIESHNREITAVTWEGVLNIAADEITAQAQGEACGLCYVEPWHNFNAPPFLRCMDLNGDILRVEIKTLATPTDEAPGRYVLKFSRWMISAPRTARDNETSNPTREKSQGELLAQRIAETVAGIDPAIKDYIKANKSRLKLSETLRISKHFNGNKTPGYMLYFGETWLATATTYQEAVTLRRALWINAISDRQ